MPFTFSHPAIVLPLKKVFGKWLSLTGLIIGSLTPDFEYFLRMKIQSDYSHTLTGVLWFNLPLGILLCFLFHQVIKKPLLGNLPSGMQKKLLKRNDFEWSNYFFRHWIIVCTSLIIGACSHIFWDAFTHHNGCFVTFFGLESVIPVVNIPVFKLLQHASTVIGGMVLIGYVWKMPTDEMSTTRPSLKYWLSIAGIAAVIIILRLLTNLSINQYGNLIVTGIAAVMIAMTLISFLEIRKNKD